MKLYSPSILKSLCQKYQFRPSKNLGQNFLVDKNILDKIIKAAELSKKDIVLEIGPGFGVLTRELGRRVKKVIAVEKDKRLCEILEKEIIVGIKNIEIVNQDILKYQLPPDTLKYKIVANLPYNISKRIIQLFLDKRQRLLLPSVLIFLLQKEVAQKICSAPPQMNLLALSVQFYAEPKIISYVSRNSFWPIPSVDSAILKITLYHNVETDYNLSLQNLSLEGLFFKVVRAGFRYKRKKLVTNLAKWFNEIRYQDPKIRQFPDITLQIEKALISLGFKNTVRAQELGVGDWRKLVYYLKSSQMLNLKSQNHILNVKSKN